MLYNNIMEDINALKEKICQKYFNDSFNNVKTLLSAINVAYANKMLDRKPEYKDLVCFYSALNCDDESVLKTIVRFDGKDLKASIYDAYREALTKTFQKIKNDCYVFSEDDYETTIDNKVKVYNIHLHSNKMLINVSKIDRNSKFDKNMKESINNYIYHRENRKIEQDYKSLSFVDNKNIKAFANFNQFLTFVYPSTIEDDFVIAISKKDALVDFVDFRPTTFVKPDFVDAKTLLDSTNNFNEITVLRKDVYSIDAKEIKPIAILATGEITELEKQIAKEYNLDIILSDAKYKSYKIKNNYSLKANQISYDFDKAF